MSLNPFESYLDTVEQSLRSLPKTERAEWREEAWQHLQDIVRAEEELGLTPEKAQGEAMRLFGDATQIGQQMAQSTVPRPSLGRTAALFSRPLIVAMLLLIGLGYAYVFTDSPLCFRALQCGGVLAFVLVPIFGGRCVGKHLRSGPSQQSAIAGLTIVGFCSLPVASVLLVPALDTTVEGAALDFRLGVLWLPLTLCSLLWSRRKRVRDFLTMPGRA